MVQHLRSDGMMITSMLIQKFWTKSVILSIAVLGLSAGLCTFATSTQADMSVSNSDLGILGGLAISSQTPYSGVHLDLGLTGHVQVQPNLNVGFYYQYYWNNYGNSATTYNHTLAVESNYLFSGDFQGLYAGAKVGLQLTGNSLPNTSTGTDIVLGPAVGYDVPIMTGVSVGGQANLLFVTQSPIVTNLNLVALLKMNF